MSHFTRKLAVAAAAVAALAGAVALPTAQAQAAPGQEECWMPVLSVCAEDVEGNSRQLVRPEEIVIPPLAKARNQDHQPWCFYGHPGFENPVAQLLPGDEQPFDRPVFSAKPGPCEY
ncbi:hypothetical protein SRB5_39710 [Streptomyces sp. RB5]|uniref:Secreted protein n=1 Tax=Streptomyces smaragdinus TaxID=2585196 RepID=A0A7K0CJY7_9ACTN|nr:hypothetical protein [Streptomyces smaragdinus]MQY13815.1 hypothetical protein [Streptomyces smaragdinus]